MGLLTMKYSEEEMLSMLSTLLCFDEQIETAVYCAFRNTSFIGGSAVTAGYVGLTDRGRLLAVRAGVVGAEEIAVEPAEIVSLRVKKAMLGMTRVDLEYMQESKKKLSFQYTKKLAGAKIPHQPENAERLTQLLSERM